MENMSVEADVPLGVAIESIELAKRRVLPLIGPSEAAVLKVDLRKLTRMKGRPETVYPPAIHVAENRAFLCFIIPLYYDLLEPAKQRNARFSATFDFNVMKITWGPGSWKT
jgi:hypothetical protein